MDPSGFLVPATTTELLHIPNEAVNLPTPPTTTTTTTTTTHVPNHNHPPYAEMITDAITALKDRNGSSRQAIAKYIERVYKDQLPQTHSALLTHHLKRLKNNGHLLMFKHSYKLPRSDYSPPSSSPPPPLPVASSGPNDTARKRGRPPKPKTPNQPNNMPVPVPVSAAAVVVDGPPPPPHLLTTTTTMVSKRKPGRPARVVSGVMGLDGIKKKNPGRPRKTKLVSGVMGPERIKRGPGRPAKNQTKPLMIPYLTDDLPPRPRRGRPKRDGSSRANAPPVNATAASNGVGIVSARRRGRPAKVGGTKKSVRGIGKPAGRPRKNNALARVPSAGTPLWMVDYGYVKSKLDNVQSRIQQAVKLLKPHLINVNAVTVAAGLQELEEISTMDVIGAPSHVAEVQEPVPPPLNFEGQEPVLQNQEPHLEQLGV